MTNLLAEKIRFVGGGIIMLVILNAVYRAHAVDWQKLASVYGRDWQAPRLYRLFADLVLYREGRPARVYKGIVSIGLLDDGIALRPNPILVPFQSPVFIPYTDIEGWDQSWYLDAKSTELSFRKAPQMRMIMPRKQVEWMLSLAGDAAQISEARPPHGAGPVLSGAMAVAAGVMAIAVFVFALVTGLPITKQGMASHSASLQQAGEP